MFLLEQSFLWRLLDPGSSSPMKRPLRKHCVFTSARTPDLTLRAPGKRWVVSMETSTLYPDRPAVLPGWAIHASVTANTFHLVALYLQLGVRLVVIWLWLGLLCCFKGQQDTSNHVERSTFEHKQAHIESELQTINTSCSETLFLCLPFITFQLFAM